MFVQSSVMFFSFSLAECFAFQSKTCNTPKNTFWMDLETVESKPGDFRVVREAVEIDIDALQLESSTIASGRFWSASFRSDTSNCACAPS